MAGSRAASLFFPFFSEFPGRPGVRLAVVAACEFPGVCSTQRFPIRFPVRAAASGRVGLCVCGTWRLTGFAFCFVLFCFGVRTCESSCVVAACDRQGAALALPPAVPNLLRQSPPRAAPCPWLHPGTCTFSSRGHLPSDMGAGGVSGPRAQVGDLVLSWTRARTRTQSEFALRVTFLLASLASSRLFCKGES